VRCWRSFLSLAAASQPARSQGPATMRGDDEGDDEGVEPEMGEVRAFFPKREEIPWWATDLSRGHFSGWR
jgi:hypothetical protein